MESGRGYKRRSFLVYKSLQIKFMVLVLFLFSLAGFAVWWEAYHSLLSLSQWGLLSNDVQLVTKQFNKILLIKMLIELALIVVISLLFSHFIAGPIYRIQEALKAVRDGDTSVRLKFRRLDELKSIAVTFNEMMEKIGSKKTG